MEQRHRFGNHCRDRMADISPELVAGLDNPKACRLVGIVVDILVVGFCYPTLAAYIAHSCCSTNNFLSMRLHVDGSLLEEGCRIRWAALEFIHD